MHYRLFSWREKEANTKRPTTTTGWDGFVVRPCPPQRHIALSPLWLPLGDNRCEKQKNRIRTLGKEQQTFVAPVAYCILINTIIGPTLNDLVGNRSFSRIKKEYCYTADIF